MAKNLIRLNKFLAQAGVASRRHIDEMMAQKRITVNGKSVTVGVRVDPTRDTILVDGKSVKISRAHQYIVVNKPKGVISTAIDPLQRSTVTSLVKTGERLFSVGRLDSVSHGLVLLTNDGALAYRLTHPRYHIPKTYRVTIAGRVSNKAIETLQAGVHLRDGITQPTEVVISSKSNKQTVLAITLYEGKNRQIRRMCGALGLEVTDLARVAFGPIQLGNLRPGQSRALSAEEVAELKQQVSRA